MPSMRKIKMRRTRKGQKRMRRMQIVTRKTQKKILDKSQKGYIMTSRPKSTK